MSRAITFKSLRRWNLSLAFLHAGQGIAVLCISRSFAIPISGTYLRFNHATQHLEPATKTLFHFQLSWLIVGFFFLSALAHLAVGTLYRQRYERNLQHGINKVRWIEYSVSASVMMVAIATLVGIYDLSSLGMIFILIAIMNLMGLVMEAHNQAAPKPNWLSYWIGCLAGLTPWLVVAFYMWFGAHEGSRAPTFVYWIFVSIFVFFSCFALNMVLQYKKVGPWKNYMYGERTYMALSLLAKSLLAWQVFAGTLRP